MFKGRPMAHHRMPTNRIRRLRAVVHKQVKSAIREALRGICPKRVLDVGTGFGFSAELLARRFRTRARIWTIDVSPEVLRRVRGGLRERGLAGAVRFRLAKAEALPFPPNHFDLVVSSLSLHHFTRPSKATSEMVRVLSRGGRLILTDWRPLRSSVIPHAAGAIPPPSKIVRQLRRLGLRTSLRKAKYWYLVEGLSESAMGLWPVENRT